MNINMYELPFNLEAVKSILAKNPEYTAILSGFPLTPEAEEYLQSL